MDKRALFAEVKAVREMSKAAGILVMPEDQPGPGKSSREQYQRITTRDWNSKEPAMQGVSRSTWFVHRAALTWGYRELFRKFMAENDEAQKRGDVEGALEAVRDAKDALERWMQVREAQRPEEPSQRRSKRQQMPRKGDWREQIHDAARPDEKAALAVLWATGLRPIELENGVDVRLLGGVLTVQIPGAKVSKATKGGQKWRVIQIDRESDVGRSLEAALDGGPSMTIAMGRRVLEAALERLGREKGHKHTLTGYTFRHQLGADLKARKDPKLTAAVMGHQSERTQSWYGISSQAKGGSWIIGAETSTPIRGQRTDVRFEKAAGMEGPRL